ncbi:MAG: glucose-6-phosphate isomerase [Bacteroidetes bacterium]|nr:glucose-6-phosphate isomerase [Bacteroidota bacterium]
MTQITLNSTYIKNFISDEELASLKEKVIHAHQDLCNKTGKGNEFLGWLDLPLSLNQDVISDIEVTAEYLRKQSSVLVVIGIGGSYLGARAVIEALSPSFEEAKSHRIIYAGHQISEEYHAELIEQLDNVDYCVAVISKSGTTTEPAIAFRLLKNHIEGKYGLKEARKRIVAITDISKGALKQLSTNEEYKTFEIADDIGGRYSVLSPVGLLPIAFAGFSINELIEGAKGANIEFHENKDHVSNPVLHYAALRNILLQKGFNIELMTSFNPKLFYLIEWWKQLFGESEGKDGKGIFTAGSIFSTDLHSLGQYIQDGQRILFETVLSVSKINKELTVPDSTENIDGLNYLKGKRLHEINLIAEEATIQAHYSGNVPVLKIELPEITEEVLGQLIYFFEMACGVSAYILGVNPFDQPGVEAYKKNMFRLLGKPGF